MDIHKTSSYKRCTACQRNKEKALQEQRDRKKHCDKELNCVFRNEIAKAIKITEIDIKQRKTRKFFTIGKTKE
jgi:hypothetical protein